MFRLFIRIDHVGQAGAYWLQIMDHYAGGWNVLIIAVCECWGVSLVYGKPTSVCALGNRF